MKRRRYSKEFKKQEEIRRLQKELKRVTMERDILKKAAKIFKKLP